MFALDNTSGYRFLRSVSGSEVYPISSSEEFYEAECKEMEGLHGVAEDSKISLYPAEVPCSASDPNSKRVLLNCQ